MSHGAVDVLDATALRANQMVVIVADPRFVECGAVRGLDAPYQPRLQQGMQVIVHGLMGEAAQLFPGFVGDGIGAEMPAAVDRRQDRETGRGDPHPHRPQPFLERLCICEHGVIMACLSGVCQEKDRIHKMDE